MNPLAPPAPDPTGPTTHLPGASSVSVVVAAYNAVSTLACCLNSVLEQEPAPDEVVVVDDGSTDGTASLLEDYGDRITVLRQPNRGEASAKNAGLRAARGEIVAFVDADDRLLPGWLAAVSSALHSRPDLVLVATDAWLVRDGRRIGRVYGHGMTFDITDQRRAMCQRNMVVGFVGVRRGALLAVGGFDERVPVASDWSAWGRLSLAGGRFGLIPQPLAEYHLVSDSLSDDRQRVLRGRIDVLGRLAEDPRATEADRDVLRRSRERQLVALELMEARDALRSGAPDARRLARRVALSRRHSVPARVKALAAAVLPPRFSRAALRRSQDDRGFRGGMEEPGVRGGQDEPGSRGGHDGEGQLRGGV